MGKDTKRYRYTGTYADTLANGQPVEPGEFVDLTEQEVKDNIALSATDRLLEVGEMQEPDATEAAAKLAKDNDIPLTAVSPTGAKGEIVVGDVERAVAERDQQSTAETGEEGQGQ